MGKGKRVRGFQRDWMDSEEISETQSTKFQPTPIPSNPQHNPERPNPTKGTRPPLTTDREGFREGRGCDLGESGWTGEGNRVVGREGCFEGGDGVGGW